MRGIVIGASAAPSELLEKLQHMLIIRKVAAALPNTLYLLSAFEETHIEGCVACKIINNMKGEDVGTYILPDDRDLSPEVAIGTFADMGSDAPVYIQNLVDVDHPEWQASALAYCQSKPEGTPERIIADGIMAYKRLECHSPEHRLEAMEGKNVTPGNPDTTN